MPGTVVQQFDAGVVGDAVRALDPDVIVPTAPDEPVVEPGLNGDIGVPLRRVGPGMRTDTITAADGRVIVAVPPNPADLPATPGKLLDGDGIPDRDAPQVCVVTDALSLSVDPHRRTTELDGIAHYVEALPDGWQTPDVIHVSTALRPGYATRYTGPATDTPLSVRGAGTPDARLGVGVDDSRYSLSIIAVYPNGAVATETVPADRFALRCLDGVSETRARRLRTAGLSDRRAVAEAPRGALTAIASIGDGTASRIRASARAVAHREVVPTGDGPLPDGDPIYVDVETDGLVASTAWLVGVLDGDAEDGSYRPFRLTDPRRPGEHLETFATWLSATASGRPVVAWNGHGFDFGIVREQLRQHCPDYLEEWEDRYLFDPLHWARTEGNAALPGRTNELDRVAGALGREPTTTGLDGETVARVYVSWRDRIEAADDPASVRPPDWDRLEAYCEDDVRALATVYDAIEAATRRPPGTTNDSTQGSLSEFT